MAIYLLNAPILTAYGLFRFEGPLEIERVKAHLASGFESAIGHVSTADFVSRILDCSVPCYRRAITMQPGDEAIVFRLLERLPEGALLDASNLCDFPFEFARLVRVE